MSPMGAAKDIKLNRESGRAGRYIKSGSAKVFIPAPLPPDPPIQQDDRLLEALSRADRAVARLDGATEVLPNADLFVYMFARKEAVDSSQIEGTEATLTDVLKFEAGANQSRLPRDVEEAQAYVDALNEGLANLARLPISLRLIREIHKTLLKGVRRGQNKDPGEFRRIQNWIGIAGRDISGARFVPPPPDEMNRALRDLERFFHEDQHLPILIKVGLIHAQFETIHPFLDGNGRVGRLLITLMLSERGILHRPLLYLSTYLKHHQQAYYENLQAVHDLGDWEGWLMFFLNGVAETGNAAAETAKAIVRLREQHRALIVEQLGRGAASGLTVLEALYALPMISIKQVSETAQVEVPAANKLVHKLEDMGILTEVTGNKRNQLFAYRDYMKLFTDEPGKIG